MYNILIIPPRDDSKNTKHHRQISISGAKANGSKGK